MATALGRGGHLPGRRRRPPAPLVRAHHVPLSLRARPHGSRPELHLRRPPRPAPDHAGVRGALSLRVRLLRPPCRKRGDPDRHPSARLHRRPHRRAEGVDHLARRRLRLATRDPQPRSRVHEVEPAHLREVPRGRSRLPRQRPGQLVPGMPDRARQRAGPRGRHLRALGRPGGKARSRAVVLRDHPLRRRAARGSRRPRLARAGEGHAAQLDRPLGGRRVRPRRRGPRRLRRARPAGPAGLHHPARHLLRHDLRGGRPRASACRRAHHPRAPRGGRGAASAAPRPPPTSSASPSRARRASPSAAPSPARPSSTPSPAPRSPSTSRTTSSWATAPARSWRCPPRTTATGTSPGPTGCPSCAPSSPPRDSRSTAAPTAARAWRTPATA